MDRSIQNDANADDNLLVEPGYLAYNMMRMWQGAVGLASVTCMVSPAYVVLRPKQGTCSEYFIHFFERNRSKYLFTAYSYGLTLDRLRLYYDDFSDIKVNTPSIEEQIKIASFLTAVDKSITLLTQKKEKLKQYKKGVMQKIFNREIRFKDMDGKNFPEWEEKRLGDVTEIVKGQQLNSNELTETGDYPCLNGGIAPSGYTDKFNTDKNTITISEGGNSCGYVNYMNTNFWCGGHCYALLNTKNGITTEFLFQYLKFVEPLIMKLRVGSGLPNIQKKDIMVFKIVEPSTSEQQKIAFFLTALDKQIEAVAGQIDKMKQWKKGLLQKMFV